jgi:exosome complex exonuclease RRP6
LFLIVPCEIALPKEARVTKTQNESETENDMVNALGMQVEVPFVPAGERKPKALDEYEKDTIVVVGKKRTKKRKRAVGRGVSSERGASQSSSTLANGEDVNTGAQPQKGREEMASDDSNDISPGQDGFDVAAVPNILDGASDNEAGGIAKQKGHKTDKARGTSHMTQFPLKFI